MAPVLPATLPGQCQQQGLAVGRLSGKVVLSSLKNQQQLGTITAMARANMENSFRILIIGSLF